MGLRFRKSIKIAHGVRLNVGLKRASLSFGHRGFSYNIGSKGSRVTVGIPGSGLSYSANIPHQNPVGSLANAGASRWRLSATPFVIAAFFLGLLYISLHSTANNSASQSTVSKGAVQSIEVTGSIAQPVQENTPALDSPVPLPRPRPQLRNEGIGPPLQISPQ
jgi:hypothetical protein